MKKHNYFKNWGETRNWMRSALLLVAFFTTAIMQSVVAQRISTTGGTYTIDNTGANTGSNFLSFTDAVNDLNFGGTFTGNVTINVVSGQSFTENVPTITSTGTSTGSITFVKSGILANPLLNSSGSTSSENDAAIKIQGGDYFTFNGINITASDSSLEYGYMLRKASNTNAARFNTITNTTILMKKHKRYSYAILQTNDSIVNSLTSYNDLAFSVSNSSNTYSNIIIGNAFNGIWLKGISTTYRDSANTITNCTIGRSGIINDIGTDSIGTYLDSYGIYATNQTSCEANGNIVRNISATQYVYGIYFSGSTNIQVNNNNISALDVLYNNYYYAYGIYVSSVNGASINSNNIHDFNCIGTPNTYIYGIYSSGLTNGTVNGNTLTDLHTGYYLYAHYFTNTSGSTIGNNTINNLSTSSGYIYGLYSSATNSSRIKNNTINNINSGQGIYGYYITGGSIDTIDNNTLTNINANNTTYCVFVSGANTFNIFNNTVQNVYTSTGTVYGYYTATANNTNSFNNTLQNVKSGNGASTMYAMFTSGITGTCNFYNNNLSDFGQTSIATTGTSSVYGAYFTNASTGTVAMNFYNNVINNITKRYTGTATAIRHLHGLFFASTSNATATYNIIGNSVSINGNNALTSSSQVVYTAPTAATSPILTLRNNIFANLTGAQTGVAKHYLIYANGAGRIGNAASTSNYNDWYLTNDSLSNGFFGYNASDRGTILGWTGILGFSTFEANSITGNPLFNTNLNSRPMFGSPILGAGIFISGYTEDILGSTRNTSTPTIGAYETAIDQTKPTIAYTPAISVYSGVNYTLTGFAQIADNANGIVQTTIGTAPRLYYKTKSNANAFVGNTSTNNGWKFVEASNTTSPFNF
jgi:hypothetical protein